MAEDRRTGSSLDNQLEYIKDLEKMLHEMEAEIDLFICENLSRSEISNLKKSRPGEYYISEGWGNRLSSVLGKYRKALNEFKTVVEEYNIGVNKHNNTIKEDEDEKTHFVQNKDFRLGEKISTYETYAKSANEIEFAIFSMRKELATANSSEYSRIVERTIRSIRTIKQEVGENSPLERKFKLDDRIYLNNLLETLRSSQEKTSDENVQNLYGTGEYLELLHRVSIHSSFLNSEVVNLFETPGTLNDIYENDDVSSLRSSWENLSLFGRYELAMHKKDNPITNGEFLTLTIGLSGMGYDSSAYVLNQHGSTLYRQFDQNSALLIMNKISAGTIQAESISNYPNLEYYVNVIIKDAYLETQNINAFKATKYAGRPGTEHMWTTGLPSESLEKMRSEAVSFARVTEYLGLLTQINEGYQTYRQNQFRLVGPPTLLDVNFIGNYS